MNVRLVRWFGRVVAIVVAALLISAPAHALDPDLKIRQLHRTSWTARDGLGFGGIRAMTQTPDGFLWFGTARGLYRFDGVRAEPIGVDRLPRSGVTALAVDSHGDLWIGLTDARIARMRRGEIVVFDIPTTGMKSFVLYIVPDPDGSIWATTRDQVHHFDGHQWRGIDDPWPLAAPTWSDPGGVWALEIARDGTVWSKNVENLYYLRRGATAFEQAPGYDGGFGDFARDVDGRLWTADSTNGRFYALPDLKTGEPVPPPDLRAAVPHSMVGVIRMDRDRTIWNANRVTRHLYRSGPPESPGEPDRFTAAEGLPSDVPVVVFEDHEGSVWVAAETGVTRFRNPVVVVENDIRLRVQVEMLAATPDAVFVYSGMRARVPDPNPDGDPGGRLFRIRPGQAPEVADPNIGQLTAMTGSPNGSLVISRDDGLFYWKDGRATRIQVPPTLQDAHVVNLSATTDALIVSFHREGVYRYAGGEWTDITPPQLRAQEGASVATDADGAVWMFYSRNRAVRWKEGQLTEHVLAIGETTATLPDRDGMIFVGDHGMARFNGSGFEYITGTRVPLLSQCFGVVRSSDDSIWVLTSGGILRIDRASLLKAFADTDAPLEYRLFDAEDGFNVAVPSSSFNTHLIAGPDGYLWFLMETQVGRIDPARIAPNPIPPPPVILGVTANARAYEAKQDLALPAGTSQLAIEYTAPGAAIPERVRFRYRLEGVDEDWIDAGSRRQAFYTNLPAGPHRFRIVAFNNDGQPNSTEASLSFTIEPTFIQSIWFRLLLAVSAAGLAWVTYRVLLNLHTARLQERFEIRIAERERIARELHDTLLQSVQGLILRFDSVSVRVPADSELYAPAREAVQRAAAVVAEGRDRVRELRTTTRQDLGQAINDVAQEIIQDDALRFTLKEQGNQRALRALVVDELLQIAREALHNAVQHAHATTVEATVAYSDTELLVEIRDDGVGLPPSVVVEEEKPGHYGLIGMHERARRIGGRLRIHSREGGGTAITVTVSSATAYRDRPGVLKRLMGAARGTS